MHEAGAVAHAVDDAIGAFGATALERGVRLVIRDPLRADEDAVRFYAAEMLRERGIANPEVSVEVESVTCTECGSGGLPGPAVIRSATSAARPSERSRDPPSGPTSRPGTRDAMCLMSPGRVVSIEPSVAVVDVGGVWRRALTLLAPEVRAGDWVVIAAGAVVRRIDPDQAAEMEAAHLAATHDGGESPTGKG